MAKRKTPKTSAAAKTGKGTALARPAPQKDDLEAREDALVAELALETLSPEDVKALPAGRVEAELGPRRGTPLSAASVRLLVQSQREDSADESTLRGLAWHRQGTRLRILYARRADVVLGYPDPVAFLRAECGLSRSTAFDRMRFARLLTEAEATYYGHDVGSLGCDLLELLERQRIGDLDGLALEVPAESGGGTETFTRGANPARLGAAVRSLAAKAQLGKTSRGRATDAEEARLLIETFSGRSAPLRRLQPKITVYGDVLRLSNRSVSNRDELLALAKLLTRLARLPGFQSDPSD